MRSLTKFVRCCPCYCYGFIDQGLFTENVRKGRNDKPEVDVIIADSGELEIELEIDEEGNQVPLHAEL